MSDFKDALDIGAYYGTLEQNYQSGDSTESKVRLQKLWMNAPPNFGTIQSVLYPSGHDRSYITHIDKVRQVRFNNKDINEDGPSWHRILPKEYYTDLSQEDSSLYDEVNSLFSHAADNELVDFTNFKSEYSWSFFFAKVVKAYDLKNQENKEIKCVASFLCYPGYKIKKNKIKDGLDNLTKKGYGPVQNWSNHFFNANEKDRMGVVSITHSLPQSGGYDTNFDFIFDGQQGAPGLPVIKLIPIDFLVSEDDKKLFSNSLIAFLGKMYDFDNKRIFNKKVFIAIKHYFLGLIADKNKLPAPILSSPEVAPSQPEIPTIPSIPSDGHISPLSAIPGIPQVQTFSQPEIPAILIPSIPSIPGVTQ